ncbi:MAG: hypothetical protein AB7P21_27470 [Lautropia sp.]
MGHLGGLLRVVRAGPLAGGRVVGSSIGQRAWRGKHLADGTAKPPPTRIARRLAATGYHGGARADPIGSTRGALASSQQQPVEPWRREMHLTDLTHAVVFVADADASRARPAPARR